MYGIIRLYITLGRNAMRSFIAIIYCEVGSPVANGGKGMCKILKEINGLTATALLAKYGISSMPPIDLSELSKKIGVSVYPVDFSNAEKAANYELGTIIGAAISDEDDLDIMYAEGMSDNRVRFTVAHEIGHCCLHANDLMINHLELRRNNDLNPREKAVNIFAGELLIPEKALSEFCIKLIRPTVLALSQIFQVSSNVMRERLNYLGYENIPEI